MPRLLYCIRDEHDPRFLAVALLICVAASIVSVLLLRQARDSDSRERAKWLQVTGIVSGFGIWATHFVAMLGYNPGLPIVYAAAPTIASLLVAIGATYFGFRIALGSPRWSQRWISAIVIGIGIAAMHYLGMQAARFAGTFMWSTSYVLASVPLAILPIAPALKLALSQQCGASATKAALLVIVSILLLHFTGMAGVQLVQAPVGAIRTMLLSPTSLALTIAGMAFATLSLAAVIALVSAKARTTLRKTEREFNIFVKGIRDCALFMLDSDGRVVTWNAGAERLKGYTAMEAIGIMHCRFYSAEERRAGLPSKSLEEARRHGEYHEEGWRYRKDGSRFWAHVTIEAVYDEAGVCHGFAKFMRDMSRFKSDQDQLVALTQSLDAALSNMQHGLCMFGPDEKLIMSNSRVSEIFEVPPDKCPPGTTFEDVFRCGLEQRAGGPVPAALLHEVMQRHRDCLLSPSGGALIVPFTESCILSIAHQPMEGGGWITTFDDITERYRAERHIEHMALHDGLTGLPNRLNFIDRLEDEITRAQGTETKVAVIGIDLDRFKEINDTYGHATGDKILAMTAEKAKAMLADGECFARFGGDEFAAFKPFGDQAELSEFVNRLEACLTTTIELDELAVHTSASIGVAVYPTDGETREHVQNNADLAMYRAKITIGRVACYYEEGMDEAARKRRVLANDLRDAIARNEFTLVFQAQKSVTTEEVIGYEALLRWQHLRDGWIPPTEFIPIAEESGEIVRIGEWVLRNACREAAGWPEPWRVAVNISSIQLMAVDLVEIVTEALLESSLPASRLELEITETAIISDKLRALHVLRQIKALGVTCPPSAPMAQI